MAGRGLWPPEWPKGEGTGWGGLAGAYGTSWFLPGETSTHVTVQLRPCPYCCVANMKSLSQALLVLSRGSRLRVTGLTQAAVGRGGLGLAPRLVLASRSWQCSPCAYCRAVAAGYP